MRINKDDLIKGWDKEVSMMNKKVARLLSLNVGKPSLLEKKEDKIIYSGIHKQPKIGPLYLSKQQLEGDGQADLINHGGEDKAVCVYSFDHYSMWEKKLGKKLDYSAFGENFTVENIHEREVCIGDIYEVGEAVVQVSQPRGPCFKLGLLHDQKELPNWIQENGLSGFYFRVLEEGLVERGTKLKLINKHPAGCSILFINQITYQEKDNKSAMHQLIEIEELAESWKQLFRKRVAKL